MVKILKRLWDDFNTDPNKFKFTESKAVVNGQKVLGEITGPYFVPDGNSRNGGRHYSKGLWEKVISDPDVNRKLERRLMMGTIGHAENFDVERFFREGLISHTTAKMWINESDGFGWATSYILDTPAGRNLRAAYDAGVKFYVSSRASGSLMDEDASEPEVDPDNYVLEGFDLVVDPGFLKADPSLVESLQKNGVRLNTNGGKDMGDDAKLLEALTKENIGIKEGLQSALNEAKAYKALGTVDELKKLKENWKKVREVWAKLGTPREIVKSLKLAESVTMKYKSMGTPSQIDRALTKAFGLLETNKKWEALGSFGQVKEALNRSFSMASNVRVNKLKEACYDLSSTYAVPLKTVAGMMKSIRNPQRVEEILKSLKEDDDLSPDDKKYKVVANGETLMTGTEDACQARADKEAENGVSVAVERMAEGLKKPTSSSPTRSSIFEQLVRTK